MEKIYSKIESISGNVITVKAGGVAYGELAEISTSFGKSLAEVIKLDRDLVSLQVFAGGRGISTGDSVRFYRLRRAEGQRSGADRQPDYHCRSVLQSRKENCSE